MSRCHWQARSRSGDGRRRRRRITSGLVTVEALERRHWARDRLSDPSGRTRCQCGAAGPAGGRAGPGRADSVTESESWHAAVTLPGPAPG
eukprot:620968-Hanusia_phi.AAC.1